MSFKVADGYVEVHARHDRASTRRNAEEAVKESDRVGKDNEGSLLRWLFKSNPKLHKMLEAPIGSIFSSPVIAAAAAVMIAGVAGFIGTALTTAILGGIAGGFIAGGAWVHANDKIVVDAYKKMQAKIKGVFYRASQPIVGPLVNAMGMIGDAFKRWEPSLNRIYTALAPLIEPFTGGILGMLESMLPGIERAMPGIQTVMLTLAEHLPGLGTAMGDFFATIAENGPLLERVVGMMITWLEIFFKVAGPILVYVMGEFARMGDQWNAITTAINAAVEWVGETWNKIPGWWDSTWGAVSGWFQDVWDSITGFFSGTSTDISTWWNDQITNISTWWSQTWGSVSTWFSELPGKIGTFLSSLPGTISGWFVQAFDAVTYGFGYAVGTWVRFMIDLPGRIVGGLVAGWTLVTGWFTTATTWITERWLAMVNWVVTQASLLPGRIGRFFQDLATTVARWTQDMVTRVIEWFGRLPSRLLSAVTDAFNRVMGVFRWGQSEGPRVAGDLVNRVVSAVTGLAGRLYNAGRDAIVGLVNGIQGLLGWAVDAAWRAARNIAQGFMDALHIGSPSKYMADKVGKWIPKGIAVGIEDNMGDIDDIAADFPGRFTPPPPPSGGMTNDNSTSYGSITLEVHVDNLQELADVKAFLDGQLRNSTKARNWAGNLYEAQGEYTRSYR